MDLDSFKQLVEDEIRRRLSSYRTALPQHLLRVLEQYLCNGGKRLRPKMALLACAGFGGNVKQAVPMAAAVEMFHNWSLIHDDVIDHDELRRGLATGHILGKQCGADAFGLGAEASDDYGRSVAILAGDALQGMAVETLLSSTGYSAEVLNALAVRMMGKLDRELIGGEQLDVEMSHMDFGKVNETLINVMMTGKTGSLLGYCLGAGAALALNAAEDKRVLAMARAGKMLGNAFQLQDDILGIFGDVHKVGKAIGSDIREGKRTLLAVRTLAELKGEELKTFRRLYGNDSVTEEDIAVICQLMEKCGAKASVQQTANRVMEDAVQLLESTMTASDARTALIDIAKKMVKREV